MSTETFDASEAGRRLGLTGRTVLDMARHREIAHVKIGRRIRFTEQHIADYLAAHTVGVGMVRTARSQAAHRRRKAA